MKRFCKCCGKRYEATPERRVVCSPACTRKYKSQMLEGNMFIQYCAECGKEIFDFHDRRFCSNECREKAIERDKNQAILDGDIKVDHLTETMAYCKKLGISYAEYQKRQTLALLDRELEK